MATDGPVLMRAVSLAKTWKGLDPDIRKQLGDVPGAGDLVARLVLLDEAVDERGGR